MKAAGARCEAPPVKYIWMLRDQSYILGHWRTVIGQSQSEFVNMVVDATLSYALGVPCTTFHKAKI